MNMMILVKTKLILVGMCVLLLTIFLTYWREKKYEQLMKPHTRRHVTLREIHNAYHEALDALRKMPQCMCRKKKVVELGHEYIEVQRELYGESENHFNLHTLENDLKHVSS